LSTGRTGFQKGAQIRPSLNGSTMQVANLALTVKTYCDGNSVGAVLTQIIRSAG